MEASQLGKGIVEEAKDRAEEEARRFIGLAIQRYAGEQTYESTTATVSLNGDEDIKGVLLAGRDVMFARLSRRPG